MSGNARAALSKEAMPEQHDREVTGKVCKDSAPSHIYRAEEGGQAKDLVKGSLSLLTAF